ncbi:MAG: VOC family protein [Myxococcota bacterium]|nr:VOC family protein [Myxococcota bacterium]
MLLINIDVPDLAAATQFYTSAFTLTVARRFGNAAVELVGGEVPIYLLVKAAGSTPYPSAPGTRDYARHWSPVHLDFAVTDLEPARDRAVAAGATLERDIEQHAWGRIAYLADPFGHGFCLLQFTGRGYDEIAS